MSTVGSRRSIAPVVFGIIVTVVFLLFIAYVANRRRAAEALALPALTIVEPTAGATVNAPLVVHFTAARPITLRPEGWGFGRYHLHAWVNGIQYMPAAADIRQVGEQTYAWSLHAIAPGSLRIHLGWGDQAHREVPNPSVDTVAVDLR